MKTAEEIIEFIKCEILRSEQSRQAVKKDRTLSKERRETLDELCRSDIALCKKFLNFIKEEK